MKRLSIILLLFILSLALFSCNDTEHEQNGGGSGETAQYPEGSIALTVDNFESYFDIRVTTDLTEDYITDSVGIHKQTKAVSYVAFVPKGNYKEVVGEVKFKLHAGITEGYGSQTDLAISVNEESVLLGDGIPSKAFRLTATMDASYRVTPGSNRITINEIYGYIIDGARPSVSEYDEISDGDRAASDSVKSELTKLVSDYKNSFEGFDTYNYLNSVIYDFKSIYGNEKDVSNKANAGNGKATVDRKNQTYSIGLYNYFLRDGVLFEQRKNEFGLVEENPSGQSHEDIINTVTPSFEGLFDSSAVYIKDANNYAYYAYTTLSAMDDGDIKDSFKSRLENYGLTIRWDKFTVKYTYIFTDGSFLFEVSVAHKDNHYDDEFVDIKVTYSSKISDTNTASVDLYTPGKDPYALEDDLEDAKKYLTGLVEIDSSTESINFTVFQNGRKDPPYADQNNYLPIRITEGGLYEFRLKDGSTPKIYGDGVSVTNYYYPAGLYFLYYYYVPYGKTDEVLSVTTTKLNDYADFDNPIPIEALSFDVFLEHRKDMQAFSFTPEESGIYEFSDTEANVCFTAYEKGELDDYVAACTKPYLTMYLEAGKSYVITVTHSPEDENSQLSESFTMTNIGDPMKESPCLSEEWEDVFFGNGNFTSYINVEQHGYYTVELERLAGIEDPYGIMYAEDGSSARKITLEDGSTAYYLAPGKYTYTFSAMSNCYLIGRMRYVTKALGVVEERNISLSYDEYTVLSADLPTIGSEVTFKITVTQKSNLLCKSGTTTHLYREDGSYVTYKSTSFKDVFHSDVLCYQWADLEPGVYYIKLNNNQYSGAAMTASREMRLQYTDEHEMQYYYMQAYPEVKREDIHVVAYHGMYYGYRVAIIEIGTADVKECSETVGGYEFKYKSGGGITVYKDGKFMTLSEMYENWDPDDTKHRDEAIEYFFERNKTFFSELYED